MRIWSIHPKFLDLKGLGVAWNEGLLAVNIFHTNNFESRWY